MYACIKYYILHALIIISLYFSVGCSLNNRWEQFKCWSRWSYRKCWLNICYIVIIFQVLDLLYLLVKYGYYDDIQDINALIIPLVSLLNGKNDKPYPEANDTQSSLYRMVRKEITNFITYSTVEFLIRKFTCSSAVHMHCSNDII